MTGSEPLPGRHALVTGALSGVRLVSRTSGPMDQSVFATRNSVGVARWCDDSGVYRATKLAVNHVTAGLRRELEEDDIRITTLMSGVADERLLEKVPAKAQMAMDNLVVARHRRRPSSRERRSRDQRQ